MSIRQRLLSGTERVSAVVLAVLLAGTTLAFGGAVWWAGPAIAGLTFVFALCGLARMAFEGRMKVLKSPLTGLGILALGLGVAQLAPLPAALATRLSPRSHQAYAQGYFTARLAEAVPANEVPVTVAVRSPVSVDRAATLRWIGGATVCLALFWGVSHFTDRLRRLYVIWGSLVGAFLLNTSIALVQVINGSRGLYGHIQPGNAPGLVPSTADLLSAPGATVLRSVPASGDSVATWAALVPDRPFLMGTLVGGPDAFLALATVGLPLALALLLQLLAPRGSRERLASRLAESGQGGLVVLLAGLLVIGAVLVGFLAGPLLSLPFAIGLFLVGFPSAWPSGLRWAGIGVTFLGLASLGGGLVARDVLERMPDIPPPVSAQGLLTATRVWADSARIVRDFPLLGTGLGSFASIYPAYKTRDESSTTAMSSLLQWWVESGVAGLALLSIAALWCLWRLPGAVRRVGTADRALVFGLIGAAAAFTLYAAVHWTVELAAVALAASALAGTCNRWLAGGTDLFVERG